MPFVFQDRRDRADQAVGVPKRQLHEQRQELQIGHDAAGENLRVLHLPGHHRVAHAGILQQRDALSQLAERDPVDGRARLRGGVVEVGERFFLGGDDGDVVPHRAGGVEHQKRKRPLPAIRPKCIVDRPSSIVDRRSSIVDRDSRSSIDRSDDRRSTIDDRRSLIRHHLFGSPRGTPKQRAALRAADEVDEILHFRAGKRCILLDLFQRPRGIEPRLQQIPVGSFELAETSRA